MEKKRSGRMTDIPQLGPEVYVDDEADITKQAKTSASPSPGALLSPNDITDPRTSFITYGTLDGQPQRERRGTDASMTNPFPPTDTRASPQLSPHRPTNSGFSFDGEHGPSGVSSNASSRRGSAVSAENVLEVLDNSVWGESIRRSFTMRRPSRGTK